MAARRPLYAGAGATNPSVVTTADGIDPSIIPIANGGTANTAMGTPRRPFFLDAGGPRTISSPDYIDPALLPAGTGGTGSTSASATDSYSLRFIVADAAVAPTDAATIALTVPDAASTPSDAAMLAILFSDLSATPTDRNAITLVAADTATAPTDAASLKMTYSDASSAPADAATLRVNFADASSTPTDARDSFVRCYCSSAAGTNVTNPTNAQGQQDGVVATMAPTITSTTATLVCTVGGIPTSGAFTSKTLLLWVNFTAAKGALDTWSATYTTTSITTATAITPFANATGTAASYLVTPLSFDVSALTLAQLAGLKITFTDTSALSDSYTVDAVALSLEGGI